MSICPGCPDLWGATTEWFSTLGDGGHSMSRKHESCLQRTQSVVYRHLWETWKLLILNPEEHMCTQKFALISRDLYSPDFLDLVTGEFIAGVRKDRKQKQSQSLAFLLGDWEKSDHFDLRYYTLLQRDSSIPNSIKGASIWNKISWSRSECFSCNQSSLRWNGFGKVEPNCDKVIPLKRYSFQLVLACLSYLTSLHRNGSWVRPTGYVLNLMVWLNKVAAAHTENHQFLGFSPVLNLL